MWLPNVNNLVIPGYYVLDHIMYFRFAEVESDIMDNPGEIDHRLLKNKTDQTPIVYLGSKYDLIRNFVTVEIITMVTKFLQRRLNDSSPCLNCEAQ